MNNIKGLSAKKRAEITNVIDSVNTERHIFTFGYGHLHPNSYQEIYASDAEQARIKMITLYANQWAFQYTEAEWEKSLEEGFFKRYKALDPVYCEGGE